MSKQNSRKLAAEGNFTRREIDNTTNLFLSRTEPPEPPPALITPAPSAFIQTPKSEQTFNPLARLPVQRRDIAKRREVQETDAKEAGVIAFNHAAFCQMFLPLSETSETSITRRAKDDIIEIQAGKLFNGAQMQIQPIPYGRLARRIMIYIHTQAVLKKNARTKEERLTVSLGRTKKRFLEMLGRNSHGKDYAMFEKQIAALTACRILLGRNVAGMPNTYETKPIQHFEAWTKVKDERQLSIYPASILLDETYVADLVEHSVPLDERTLDALGNSAMALDIYVWLAYRLRQIKNPHGIRLSWYALQEQFGPSYGTTPNQRQSFRTNFKNALKRVLFHYSHAQNAVQAEHGALRLKYCEPPIRKLQIQLSLLSQSV